MTHASLFSGIGGFDLASEWMEWDNLFHCEINPFCQKVLKYYWPNATTYTDIKTTDFTIWRNRIDILTGGFPCQPISNAGKQLGEKDDRYLYEYMLMAIRQIKPRWIVAENVYALTSPKFKNTFEYICSSMEAEDYQVSPYILPASAVEGEHERYRVWIIAYSECARLSGQGALLGQMQPAKIGNRQTNRFVNFIQGNSMPYLCSSHNGFSRRLSEQSLHAIGNSVVPQLVYEIFKTIQEYENINP